ncbi:restriction endonuclease subunit S [Porticoccaceae bacterium LTM1]|nr:restriction endonuclease subunit S [Porticoccaceae bacterium LTM1]
MSEVAVKELPNNWQEISLGDLIKLEYGKSLTVKDRVETGEISVFGSSGNVGRHDQPLVTEQCLIVGRKGNVGHIFISHKPCWPIDTVYYVIPPKGLDIKYLYYQLGHLDLGRLDKSTAIPGLNRNDAYKVAFKLAPLDQQKRIVAKIEELFSHIDAGIEALNKAKQLLKQYRQSVLKAAVTGELTKEWREQNKDKLEPASQLLERILTERRQKWEEQQLEQFKAKGKMPKNDKWKEKYKEPELPGAEDLPEIPEGWEWVSLQHVFDVITDGDHQAPPKSDCGIPFLVIGDVNQGVLTFGKTRFVPQSYYDSLADIRKPLKGDLLYTVVGSYGIPVRVDQDVPFCVQRHIAILKPNENISVDYLYHVLSSGFVFKQATEVSTGTAQKTVPLGGLREIKIPLPSTLEQAKIANDISSKIDQIERADENSSKKIMLAGKNKQSILASAFSGGLL